MWCRLIVSAVHLKQRLPSATRLTLAFRVKAQRKVYHLGTQRTANELMAYGNRVRRNGN